MHSNIEKMGKNFEQLYRKECYNLFTVLKARKDIIERMEDTLVESLAETDQENGYFTKKLREYRQDIELLNKKLNEIESRIQKLVTEANTNGIKIQFEIYLDQNGLGKEHKYLILGLFYSDIDGRKVDGVCGLQFMGYTKPDYFEKSQVIADCLRKRLIDYLNNYANLLSSEYMISDRKLLEMLGGDAYNEKLVNCNVSDAEKRGRKNDSYLLTIRQPVLRYDQIVLNEATMREIEKAICSLKRGRELFQEWGFADTITYGTAVTMLFYGPPGTGKTATAEAIAQKLGKNIAITNYAHLISKWFGESEKNLVRVFHEANKNNCVLVFDEAEALFGNRLSEHNHSDRTYNYMTNILMQQMERFDGIVILTTNHNLAMDEAFDRRIMLKLKFEIPEAEERSKIWRTLIPHKTPLAPDVDFNTLGAKFRLSGGEIKNAILNAIKECAYQGEHVISMAILTNCAEKEIANARVQREKKNIGFNID